MKKIKIDKLLPSLLLVIIIILASLIYTYKKNDDGSFITDGDFSMHMIDVGQGDAILLEDNGVFMLVDAGPNSAEADLMKYLDSCGVKEIKYALFTHPHEDHIGSGDAVLEKYDVDTVLMPNAKTTSKAFENLLYAIDNEDCETVIPKQGDEFTLKKAKITVLTDTDIEFDDMNKMSIVIRIDYGSTSFLLTGDADTGNENDIMQSEYSELLDTDLLKVGHHGSSDSTGDSFLNKVSPDYAFISCGVDNSYGHPHYETTTKLSNNGINIFRCDLCGTVVAHSDGKNITVKTEY